MSATVSYKHLYYLVNQLINVVDQVDVTMDVCHSEVEREHRRSRLDSELRKVLYRLRETQRDLEQYMSPVAPLRKVESSTLDDEWENLIETLYEHLECASHIPTTWFRFDAPKSTSKRFTAQVRRDNIARFIRTLDNLWENLDEMEERKSLIRRVVQMVNVEFSPENRADLVFGRRQNGTYGWQPIYVDSSSARGYGA